MQIPEQVALYDRLGGVYNIATVVDDFIDRIMVDPRLNANPRVDEAHHRVLPPGFKYLVTEMVCWATGGPQQYSGRSMEDTHRLLMITPQEWQAFLDDFQQTLDKFNVPPAEQEALLQSSGLYCGALEACDHAIASTPLVAERMRRFINGQTYVVENCLDETTLAIAGEIASGPRRPHRGRHMRCGPKSPAE